MNSLEMHLLQKMFVNKNEILNPNDFLHCCLNNLINNNELIDSDLNTLLFICYKQFLNPNLLTQSLLITILDRFNDIENYKNIYLPWEYLQYNTQDKDLYLRMFANKKILNITNDEIRWN